MDKRYYSGSIELKTNRTNSNNNLYTLMGILIENGYSITANKGKDTYRLYFFKAIKEKR